LPAVELLARFFLGESQKLLAYDAKVSTGTIAGWCASALCTMAPGQIVSRAPILLVMAAHCRYGMPLQPARLEHMMPGDSKQISCEMPGASFGTRLSRSELEVALLAIEGKKHCEIATARKTSQRTTANQLASIFGKLKVSGRAELRSKAIAEASMGLALRKAGAPMPRAIPHQPTPILSLCAESGV
jgi:DNA-binding CsgD family transcriptional regulator